MKRISLLVALLFIVTLARIQAQDTVKWPDPWYAYKPLPTNTYNTLNYFMFNENGAPNNQNVTMTDFSGISSGNLYGIAVTFYEEPVLNNPASYAFTLYHFNDLTFTPSGSNYYISIGQMDSIQTWNAPLVKNCTFLYELEKDSSYVPCYEFFFDSIKRIDPSATDTFYIGGRYNNMQYFGSGLGDRDFGQNWIMCPYTDPSSISYVEYMPQDRAVWGVLFPIVKLRCTVPRGFRIEENGGQYTAHWRSDTNAAVYQVAVRTDATLPDSGDFTTTASELTLAGLSPNTGYRVYLRKRCDYCATSWSETVWSDWVGPMVIGDTNTASLPAMPQTPSFILAPNPASATVNVSMDAMDGLTSIELLDISGRNVLTYKAISNSHTLDISALPRGTYFVRVTGEKNISVRKLIIE